MAQPSKQTDSPVKSPENHSSPNLRKRSLPYHNDGTHYFEQVSPFSYPVFFDSNAASSNGRFDIISAAPCALLTSGTDVESPDNSIELTDQINITLAQTSITAIDEDYSNEKIVETVDQLISTHTTNAVAEKDLPFVAGLIGLLSYDFGLTRHTLNHSKEYRHPNILVGIYQWAIVIDHTKKRCHLVADLKLPQPHWNSLLSLLENTHSNANQKLLNFELTETWQSNLVKKEYDKRFNKAIDYIESGDCYQVNLAQRFSSRYQGSTWQAYQQLRTTSPTPFALYIETPNTAALCLSPERFISVHDGHVTTQPIKGTRKRGANTKEDQQLMEELRGAEKDRAENLMIVDLLRNDLGKHCIHGSIAAPELFKIETHPNVHHMVSTITGALPESSVSSSLSLLLGCLPGGSITGAPKKRAMEIIAELEPHSRSLYCGSCAYIDRSGNMDSNILIRSLLVEKDEAIKSEEVNAAIEQGAIYCWGGGGIVADSKADEEYAEALQKIQNLLDKLSTLKNK